MRTARTFGDYEVLRELGRGGMGVVYLAEHRADGVRVALKTVSVTDARFAGSLRREILALSRLAHPRIVKIVAHGVSSGMPWYAMAFEQGITLRARLGVVDEDDGTIACEDGTVAILEGATTVGPPGPGPRTAGRALGSEDALTILRGLCAPLAYMHGEGFVHRDLKPENVLIRPDGSPVIVDFGLVTEFGAEREDVQASSDPMGTALYMAPEQWDGSLLDARADIYALGCIAYELLTGRPPFFGATVREIGHKHAASVVTAPSLLAPGIPPELEQLVLQMLAKLPKNRIGHVDAVARTLAALGARDLPCPEAPKPRSYLYRAELAGRDELLAPIGDRLRRLAGTDAGGGVLLFRGESGVGKTRLALAALEQARRLRVPSLAGRCDPGSSLLLGALRPLLLAVVDRCRERGSSETERLLGPGGRRAFTFAPFEPALAELPGVAPGMAPERLGASDARRKLLADFADLLEGFAGGRALVLAIDDLQWADELSLSVLTFLVRSGRLEHMRALVLATQRSEDPLAAVDDLAGHPSCQIIDVALLTSGALGAIVSDMLSDPDPPREITRALERKSEGNPFYLAEYLRALVLQGDLARDEGGRWHASVGRQQVELLPIPSALLGLVAGRLDALGGDARHTLETAAVLGREVDVEILAPACELDEAALAAALWELARRHMLVEPNAGVLRFEHDKIREATLACLPAEELRRLHGRAAGAIASRQGADPDAQADLAQHWRDSGDARRARDCFLAAARRAVDLAALGDAEKHYRAVLELSEGASTLDVEAMNELGASVFDEEGRQAEALASHRDAEAMARALGDRSLLARSLRGAAEQLRLAGELDAADPILDEALQIAIELRDRNAEAQAMSARARLERARGRNAEAEALRRECLAIHRERGNVGALLTALPELARTLLERGAHEEAETLFEEVLGLARSSGSRREATLALAEVAGSYVARGRADDALAAYTEALTSLRAIGNRRSEVVVLLNMAGIHAKMGHTRQAIEISESCLLRRARHGRSGHRSRPLDEPRRSLPGRRRPSEGTLVRAARPRRLARDPERPRRGDRAHRGRGDRAACRQPDEREPRARRRSADARSFRRCPLPARLPDRARAPGPCGRPRRLARARGLSGVRREGPVGSSLRAEAHRARTRARGLSRRSAADPRRASGVHPGRSSRRPLRLNHLVTRHGRSGRDAGRFTLERRALALASLWTRRERASSATRRIADPRTASSSPCLRPPPAWGGR
ncbi:MAG: protein kinase [Acidobacteriota bacterium]